MANEDLASQSWTNLPPPQFGGGLLSAPQGNRYQQIMSQMRQFNQPVPQGLLDTSGGYNDKLYDLTAQQGSAVNSFNQSVNQILGSNSAQASMAAQKAAADAAFAQLTPGEQASMRAMEGPNLVNFLTPLPIQILMSVLGASPAGTTSSGGVSSTSGSPMSGIASTGNVGQVANANTTAGMAIGNAAAGNVGTSVGTTGGVSSSSGSSMGGMGSGAAGVAATSAATGGVGGGGGGGGGGGCCFIMLEARYGDGTMDRVVRRYRDEKVTERNKRGYYKLAEVFIPLMRKSKLFSFFVVKTFADPAVCYAKWYYGENKWGWIFKPLEKFWMSLFDTLGTDTKFIRENGETV
jgi:hypothetical protein